MPGLGRYPCTSCHYVAGNRRMLARHAVLIHSDKVFKCPVCPFITRYAANWYRHKRDLHGLTRVTNCELCGFFANSTEELAEHKEIEHPEHLQKDKYKDKYAKERLRLSGGGIESQTTCEPIAAIEKVVKNLDPDIHSDEKEETDEDDNADSITFSLPLNGFLDTNGGELSANGRNKTPPRNSVMSNAETPPDGLSPLKVKRTYNCNPCDLSTSNPREFLYHLRDVHGQKINVYECKYCIYASKHIQKLTRHCGLVHRQLITKDPEYLKQLEDYKEKKSKPGMNSRPGVPLEPNIFIENDCFRTSGLSAVNKPLVRNRGQPLLKCSSCSYQTRNKGFLQHHEKTVHFKKKIFRCLQCSYTTNEKTRYSKHLKYHTLPKTRCEFCSFKSAYKWNMDRHMKYHETGAEGAFQCNSCNFTTATKQSYKSHITNHHNSNSSADECNEQEDFDIEQNDSREWVDVDDMEEEESFMTPDENLSSESYDFTQNRETADTVWKDGKVYQKTLHCKLCDFKAAWPFELKKHEENHKSQKKHPCPLCGMRFEHLAWLAKHLRRVHQENSQAKNIAAAFELLKPTRRRPGKEYVADSVLPMFQEVLKQNNVSTNKVQEPPKSSMLSTLLNKPLQPIASTSLNKFNVPYKSKALASAVNMSRQLRMTNYFEKSPESEPANLMSNGRPKNVPTCNVCGYKTRWVSELQRHMRVHSQEKPFQCPKCKYHCKWKGDLNRHLMKYHGIKVPSPGKKISVNTAKLRLKRPSRVQENSSNWQFANQEFKNKQVVASTPFRSSESDGPLDLTLAKETFPNINAASASVYDPYDFEKVSSEEPVVNLVSPEHPASNFKSPLDHLHEASYPSDDSNTSSNTKRKYQCPFCTFGTTTASRFHVHIVQHYNKRPFMCSVCGYNSNWEWDITKHIKLKNCRDKFHNKACVLLTDESGRRNYEKYEKYLVDLNAPPPTILSKPPDNSIKPDLNSVHNVNRPTRDFSKNTSYESPSKNSNYSSPYKNSNYDTSPKSNTYETSSRSTSYDAPSRNINFDTPPKTCSYDFRNIGSNFEDTPENIVVTPDINIGDESSELMESQAFYGGNHLDADENMNEKGYDSRWFVCKHCNFKHSTKRVVVSHLSVHAGIKPFRCRACGIASNWRHVIVRHVKDVHNGYMNEVEDRINYTQEGLVLRLSPPGSSNQSVNNALLKQHIPEFGCKICPYKCDKEFYMKFHMKQHRPREGAIYRCEYCPYFVKFKKTLIRHTKLHMPPTPNVINKNSEQHCNISEDPFQYDQPSYTDEIYDPQMNDSADDSINISFNTLSQFSYVDPVSPPKEKRHICESCPYKTDNKTQYLYHKQFHRPNPSAPFKCSACSYWATMQHLLTQHQKVHSEGVADAETEQTVMKEKDVSDVNSSVENSPSDYDWMDRMSVVYIKRDTQVIKMFKCNFCPMMNKKKANVKVHQKMHGVIVNDGKFACSYCDYQCLNQGGLTNHIKMHQKTSENGTILEGAPYHRQADGSRETLRPKPCSYGCAKCPAMLKSARDLEKHSQFHGSSLPFACNQCDYRARHKTHLCKHMTVHSSEYQSKHYAPQSRLSASGVNTPNTVAQPSEIPLVKKVDQMLLLEASEMSLATKKTGEEASLLKKCVFCPAPFIKTSTLAYHISLHGSEGEYKCSQCDYAVNRLVNLTVHLQVHPKKKPVAKPRRPPLRTFPCSKCPAVFYKQDRFDRHMSLHGKNYRYVCQHCDYSVHFAANLIKHRAVHVPKTDAENATSPIKAPDDVSTASTIPAAKPLAENTNFHELEEKRLITFICDRCPYVQNRKDAVQSHQRRHWAEEGYKCPYCDYTSMQNGFLQNHIKTHIQSGQLFPPLAFMTYDSFKIFCKDEETEELLFDIEMVKDKVESSEISKSKRKRKHDDSSGRRKVPKIHPDTFPSSEISNKTKVPVVVLSDIFHDKELKKWAPQLKIPKLKITKCTDSVTNEKIYSKINISYDSEQKLQTTLAKSKPKLVVKISKVENCHNHYSVSTKTSDESFTTACIASETVDNDNSNQEDSLTSDSPPVKVCASPVPADIEENTITSNLDSAESLKDVCDVPTGDSNKLIISIESNKEIISKSDESFSSDTVSESMDMNLCDELNVNHQLSFTTELNLTNGETDIHLANGLDSFPDEIEVKL